MLRVSFGLLQASVRFQEMMNKVLQKMSFLKMFMDYISVHTPGTSEDHIHVLEEYVQYSKEAF